MAIKITHDNFYLGFWHFQFPYIPGWTKSFGNVLACAWRKLDQPQGPWTLLYRFRYTVDNKDFDSDDPRSWYEMRIKSATSDQEVKAKCGEVLRTMTTFFGKADVDFYEFMCDGDQAMEQMIANPPPFMKCEQSHVA